jgi:hypothetical protein
VLEALNHPGDGEPRVDKSYRDGIPPQDFVIDEPGCTGIVPFQRARDGRLR